MSETGHLSQAQRKAADHRALVRNRELSYERDRCMCVYCGHGEVQAHHVIYRSRGGSNELDNLISLCPHHHEQIHAGKLYCAAAHISPCPNNPAHRVHIGWVFSEDKDFSKRDFRSVR